MADKVSGIMKWLGKERLRFLRDQRGLTLLEVLVAVAILAAIGVGLLNAIDTNAKATQQLDEEVVATNLATAYFEAIKAVPYAETYPKDQSPLNSITVPPQYIVNVGIQFPSNIYVEDGITYFTWSDTYSDETFQKIAISVSRDDGKHILSVCTFKTKRVVPE